MESYILSCCSTADVTLDFLEKRNIEYISFHYTINGKEYKDDLGQSMSFQEFYQLMREGATTKTSQVNVDEFVTYFEEFLKAGQDVLHVSLSTGLSGSFNSARIAKEVLEEKYPTRRVLIVDSLCASSGYGLLMDRLSELRENGMKIEELYQWAEQNKLKVNHWFYSTDLSYYVKGGRISKTAGFIGSLLNIYPLLHMDNEGKLTPRFKVVGRKKVITKAIAQMVELAKNGVDYDGKCYISHADFIADAQEVAKQIERKFPKLNGRVEIFSVGTTIGSHTGPGTLAIFFFGDKR